MTTTDRPDGKYAIVLAPDTRPIAEALLTSGARRAGNGGLDNLLDALKVQAASEDQAVLTFPNFPAKLQAEAAIDAWVEETNENLKVNRILGLDRTGPTRSGDIIRLGSGSYVVEVLNAIGRKGQTLWAVIVDGERTHALYETKDLALLAYVARGTRSDMERSALAYGAARLLNAKTAPDED